MNGQKIQAIKMLREQSGLGLKESKDIVDQLAP
ncbi:ribosomal protein L7/L12 [Mycolicibacterium hippocampi]|nr:ribosomal protein L7/L12 [Mycolicibacterium hippocampi]